MPVQEARLKGVLAKVALATIPKHRIHSHSCKYTSQWWGTGATSAAAKTLYEFYKGCAFRAYLEFLFVCFEISISIKKSGRPLPLSAHFHEHVSEAGNKLRQK